MSDISKNDIEEAIEKTLLYYKLFNSGINLEILHYFLLEQKVSKEELGKALESLIDKKKIVISDDMIYLNKEIETLYTRKNKTVDSKLTQKLLNVLNKVPFVSAIAFSGGTANYGLENHEDIDLFIITKPFTVYVVYLIIHIISLIYRSRKILCINYLVDEKAIQIQLQRDLFTAHQIIALKPFKNADYLRYFLSSNDWVKKHYPNFIIPDTKRLPSSLLYSLFRPFNILINLLYRFRYNKYLVLSKDGSVVLDEHVIKLHTNDYRVKIINEFHNQWKRYSIERNKIVIT
ncbi:MAG: hypothetical protein FIA82_10985 [Melioribacter sp.]|nr:hypothetical protein [Melioribacter sp.]